MINMTQKEILIGADKKKDAPPKVKKAEPTKVQAKEETKPKDQNIAQNEKSESPEKNENKTTTTREIPKEKKEDKQKKEDKPKAKEIAKGEWDIIEYPHLSEKSIANVESQNKIIFIVKLSAKRSEIKKAVEKMFDVKVAKVNMLITTSGKKKAYVRLKPEYSAADIATRLGMM